MRSRCINCGEQDAIRNLAVCEQCKCDMEIEVERQPRPPIEDCGRFHPFPGCRCKACAAELERAFDYAAQTHAKLAKRGRGSELLEPQPPAWCVGVTGKVHFGVQLTPEDMKLVEQAMVIAGMKRNPWIRRAVRRQAWLELQGEASVVKRLDDLTRAVAQLMQEVRALRDR